MLKFSGEVSVLSPLKAWLNITKPHGCNRRSTIGLTKVQKRGRRASPQLHGNSKNVLFANSSLIFLPAGTNWRIQIRFQE